MYLSKAAEADAGAKQVGAGPEWLKETRVGMELLGLSTQQIDRALAERKLSAGRQSAAAIIAARMGASDDGIGVEASADRSGG